MADDGKPRSATETGAALGRTVRDEDVMRGFPPPPERRVTAATIYAQPYTRWFMQHVREVEPSASVGCRSAQVAQLPVDLRDLGELHILVPAGDKSRPVTHTVDELLGLTRTDAFAVLHRGVIVYERYFASMTPETPHMWQSVSKSLVACVAGILAERGVIDPEQPVLRLIPELAGSGYDGASIRDLLDMRVGVDFSEDYDDPDSEISELDRLYGARPSRSPGEPGSSYEFAMRTKRKGEHGGDFHYVSLDINVLGWAMERATGARLPDLIRDELWSKLGGEHEAYIALDGAGSAQAEGGFCSSLRDVARFTQMICDSGRFNGSQIVPAAWIDDVRCNGDKAAFAKCDEAGVMHSGSYRSCFWVSQSADHTAVMGSGIYGQMLYANAEADVAMAKFSTQELADDPEAFVMELALFEQLAEALAG